MMAASNEAQTDKLRIVHVFRAPLGGLFRHVVDLAAEQSARGCEVGMFFNSGGNCPRVAAALARIPGGLKLGVGMAAIQRNPGISDVFAMARLLAWLRKVKPDIVHGHGSKGGVYARLSGLAGPRGGAIRAYTPHGGSFNYRPGKPLHRAYMLAERLMAPMTDVFLFESAYIAGRFDAFVGAADGVRRIVANGISPAEFEPIAANADAAELLYVGELRAAKGIDTLLDAIALIGRSRGVAPRAVLVGSGPDEAVLTERARRLGVSAFVSFPGPMPIREAFKLGRILVVPSRAESMPYVVLEAAGARVPMLATDVGGIPEILRAVPQPSRAAQRRRQSAGAHRGRARRLAGATAGGGRRPRRLRRREFLDPDHGEFGDGRIRRSHGATPTAARRGGGRFDPNAHVRSTMAAFSARDMQKVAVPARSPERPASRANADVLRRLAAEPASAAYSRVVVAGVVRAIESALIVLTGLAVYFAYVVRNVGQQPGYFPAIVAVAALSIVTFQSLQCYTVPAFRHPVRQMARVAAGWALVFLAVFAALFFLKLDGAVSRVWMAGWFALGFAALALERALLSRGIAKLARSGRLERRAVVVGGGEFGRELLRDLAKSDEAEVRMLGVFDDRAEDRAPDTVEGYPKLGNVDDLVEFARATRVDLVIFALPITAEQRILQMLRKLWVLPIDIRLAAHANRLRFRPRSYSYVGKVPVLDLFDKPIADWDVVIKLAFDKIVGTLALIALSPALAVTALAIKLDSRGPVLFKQKRYGFNNELVEVFKFRSMYVDKLDPTAAKLVTRDDPRVTRVGRFIRKTSLDELPQLFNVVLKGDLSLVGPRPHAIHAKAADRQYDEVVDGYFARHRVKPGITGWAQINGWRGETDTQEKIQQRVEHDLYYIENWSILLDLYILAITPLALLKGKNAF